VIHIPASLVEVTLERFLTASAKSKASTAIKINIVIAQTLTGVISLLVSNDRSV
jgi:hypothetical protein